MSNTHLDPHELPGFWRKHADLLSVRICADQLEAAITQHRMLDEAAVERVASTLFTLMTEDDWSTCHGEERDAWMKDAREMITVVTNRKSADRMEKTVRYFAASGCCQTDGCSVDNPMCDAMIARAAIQGRDVV